MFDFGEDRVKAYLSSISDSSASSTPSATSSHSSDNPPNFSEQLQEPFSVYGDSPLTSSKSSHFSAVNQSPMLLSPIISKRSPKLSLNLDDIQTPGFNDSHNDSSASSCLEILEEHTKISSIECTSSNTNIDTRNIGSSSSSSSSYNNPFVNNNSNSDKTTVEIGPQTRSKKRKLNLDVDSEDEVMVVKHLRTRNTRKKRMDTVVIDD